MSRVRKLSIRGIRNFSDTEETTIIFSRPLTLIIGQNGVGKTTIIECLRYITTGEFPPGSDKGKSFVHDPMLKKQMSVQVRGCVKGEFFDREGKILTVSRTMESSRYQKTIKFKSLDNSVSIYNPTTKKKDQITNRCADVDVEVMNALGVSKAILNNVIFCHQDDANWPLSENKTVKDRFDAIFETTNYNKALEYVRKLSKAKAQDLKIFNAEKHRIGERLEVVKAKETLLADYQQRKEDVEKKIENMRLRLEPVKERLEEIKKIEIQFTELKMEMEKKKIEYSLANNHIKSLRSRVKELYNGSDEELEKEIASYDSSLNQRNEKISNLNNDIHELSKNEENLSKIMADYRIQVGTLQQQIKDQTKKIIERNELLNTALSMWNLDAIDQYDSENDIQNIIEKIESKTNAFERSINTKRMNQDQEENLLEKKVDAARDKRSKINSELKRSEKDAEDMRNNIRNTRFQISQFDGADKKLDSVDSKLEEMDNKIEQINSLMKSENLEEKIKIQTKKFENNEDAYTQLDTEMTIIQDQSAMNVKSESLNSELKNKNKEIDNLKSQHEENIKKLLGKNKLPEDNLKKTVEDAYKIISSRLDKLNQEIQNNEYKLMTLNTVLEHSKKELDSKIKDIENDKEKVNLHCKNYENYEDILLQQQIKVKNLQDKRGMIAHQGIAYKEYMKEFEKSKCCALCERIFENSSNGQKLFSKLKNGIRNHPEILKQCERELKSEQEKYEILLSMKITVESIIKFEEIDKNKIIDEINKKDKEYNDLKKKISELNQLKLEPEKKIEMMKNMIPDLTLWDRYLEDILHIHINLDELQKEMSEKGRTTHKTMEEIQLEREELKQIIRKSREEIDELRLKLDERREELRRASEKRTKCLEEQIKIHNEMQQLRQLKDNLEDLLKKEETLISSIQTLRQQLIPAEEELEKVIRELDELKSNNRLIQENDRKMSKEYEKHWDKLNSIQTEITKFQSQNLEKKLDTLNEKLKNYEKSSEENKEKKLKKEELLNQIKEDISCHETKKRNLTDNLELRKSEKSIKILENIFKELRSKIQSLNFDEIKNEKDELNETKQLSEGEINKASGNREEIKTNMTQLMRELNKPEYKTARDAHKEICLQVIVTKQAIEDCNMYIKVLDLAMTEYHEERITTVNRSMHKLWGLIYYGNDTKSIQIRAEAVSTIGETNRRQFNYKLVQIKHGQELDMRGKSSAGQRVLASIILRLALAETFCEQCGVLALDEPTTNLDEENSNRLAGALAKYIAFRAKHQKNFQLIIITHDETFIRRLSDLSTENSTQELYRKDDGLTSIRRLDRPDNYDDDGDEEHEERLTVDTQDHAGSSRHVRKRAHVGTSSKQSKKPYAFDDDF